MIESTTKDGVAVLAMRHGKANALDTELCQALCGALDDAADDGAAAVVLSGAGTVFSAGVDLKRVTAGREEYVAAFLPELRRAFTRLATFELPVVAAVNGHAIAGGFILFAAADWAVMAEGPGRAGVTELRVGVRFPLYCRAALGQPRRRALRNRMAMAGHAAHGRPAGARAWAALQTDTAAGHEVVGHVRGSGGTCRSGTGTGWKDHGRATLPVREGASACGRCSLRLMAVLRFSPGRTLLFRTRGRGRSGSLCGRPA